MNSIAAEVKEAYSTKIVDWKQEPFGKFLGGSFKSNLHYELGITKPDIFKGSFRFSVNVILTYTHQLNGEVFQARTVSDFDISYRYDAPTIQFLYDLIKKATVEFAEIFRVKMQNTPLLYHEVIMPKLEHLQQSIQDIIDYWDAPAKKFKEGGGKRLDRFKNLPVIPEHKSYNGNNVTLEQIILRKLETNKEINLEEQEIFKSLGEFYNELNNQLAILNYNTFTTQDIQDF